MKMEISIGKKRFRIVLEKPFDLSIPIHFGGEQPNFFGVPRAEASTFEGNGFIGDTKRGGSCNVKAFTLNPHCNGTHTESIGHIVDDEVSIHECLPRSLFMARLISVQPQIASDVSESYPTKAPGDLLITKKSLLEALKHSPSFDIPLNKIEALIIRTNPNDESKKIQNYGENLKPAFFSTEAMKEIVSQKIQHLLIDLPSADKMHDEGKLLNHRLFWNLPPSGHLLTAGANSFKTITEFIYVPNEIAEGFYLLDLQIAAFKSDAAPSRPLLYALEPIE